MSKILNLGIDISLHAATCCLLGQEGRLYGKVFNVDNNLPGFETLKHKITEICRLEGYDTVRIGLEATSMYGFHLLSFFSNTCINGVSFHIYQINAKYINRFKKVFSEKEKTDVIDARVVAEYLKFEMLPVEFKPDSPYLPLQRLIRYRYHTVKNIEKEKKTYLANLFLKFPGWVQNRPIKTLGVSSIDITTELTLDEISEMPLEQLALIVSTTGKNHWPDYRRRI